MQPVLRDHDAGSGPVSVDLGRALIDALDDQALDQLADLLAARIAARTKPHVVPLTERVLTVRAAAELVGLHPRTVLRAIAAGDLDASKLRNRWRIERRAVEQWRVAESRTTPASHAVKPAQRRGRMTTAARPLAQAFVA